MAAVSGIPWTKSTFNPWIGCTKVGPGCDHCYAEAQDGRKRWGGEAHWGTGVPRFRTSIGNWNKVRTWNKQAPASEFAGRKGFWPVFCASLADVFDNEAPAAWRDALWDVIGDTPNLSWLLVTKRVGNVEKMVPNVWMVNGFPSNVRLLSTIVNQDEAHRDLPKLLALPCKNGVSYEPALGPVDWRPWLGSPSNHPRGIEWMICGGESSQGGHKAREFMTEWARNTMRWCKRVGTPFFMKQLGSNSTNADGVDYLLLDRAGAEILEWPLDLRVREFPQ